MFHRIMIALDGSDASRKALDIALDISKSGGAEVLALHVITKSPLSDAERRLLDVEYLGRAAQVLEVESVVGTHGEPLIVANRLLDQYAEASQRLRHGLAERLLQDAKSAAKEKDVAAPECITVEGDPAACIVETAKSPQVDLIALGHRGMGTLSGILLGSVAHKVTQSAPCSCLTVTA